MVVAYKPFSQLVRMLDVGFVWGLIWLSLRTHCLTNALRTYLRMLDVGFVWGLIWLSLRTHCLTNALRTYLCWRSKQMHVL